MGKPTDQHTADFFRDLSEQGEEAVRAKLAAGIYAGKRIGLAEEWLRQRDQERSDFSQSEQITIARSAKDAAWAAARAAERAARHASMANKIAIAAAVIATISAVIAWLS
jgi:hypothetical protein